MNSESKPQSKKGVGLFFLDALMIFLLVINLAWIVFDWLFEYEYIRSFLYSIAPGFTEGYASAIHPRFILIDLLFVSLFLTEFFYRWAMAIYQKTYHRWFFFPFIHFYDLIGCIPIGGFRFFRLLRIISIVYRLQKAGIIDLGETSAALFLKKYYQVLLEELSNRVTLNILSDIQQEVRNGGPVAERIMNEIILPQKEPIVEWMSNRIEIAAQKHYGRNESDIRDYVEEKIQVALDESEELGKLSHVPLLGPVVKNIVQRAVSEIVFHVVHGMIQDIASRRNRVIFSETADIVFDTLLHREDTSEMNQWVRKAFEDSIEIIKDQVRVQQWKLRDLSESEEDFQRLFREEMMNREK